MQHSTMRSTCLDGLSDAKVDELQLALHLQSMVHNESTFLQAPQSAKQWQQGPGLGRTSSQTGETKPRLQAPPTHHEEVGGLEVAVHDALLMDGVHSLRRTQVWGGCKGLVGEEQPSTSHAPSTEVPPPQP